MTVFGGNQTRPNIHIKDIAAVYKHFIDNPDIDSGCFNAGFENISIGEIAEMVAILYLLKSKLLNRMILDPTDKIQLNF